MDKSVEAYILALESINRLSIQYRVEVFCYLICNGWELLLKAKILEDADTRNAIYYKKQRGKPRRSPSLRDCLNRVIPNQNDPERRNVERIAELRDEAVHLVFPTPGAIFHWNRIVNWLMKQHRNDPDFLSKARSKVKGKT